jgi:hypothetical protein
MVGKQAINLIEFAGFFVIEMRDFLCLGGLERV